MARRKPSEVAIRDALFVATCLVVAYLSLLAAFSWVPPIWFGKPESTATFFVVAALLTALCVLSYRVHAKQRPGAIPTGVISILFVSGAALAISSYAPCHDGKHPPLFTPLMWTIGTVKGNTSDYQLANGKACPLPTPEALSIARVTGQSALYVGLITITFAFFTTQVDRARIRYARSVTSIVDVDDDARSMVTAVAQTRDKRSRLALIVAESKVNEVRELRGRGARIIAVDIDRPEMLAQLPLWKKIDKLYLLAASPTTNLRRLAAIEKRLGAAHKQRLPLIVRIDDPWQAESFRAQRLGGSDTRWAADAVGVYEVTATRLLEQIISTGRVTKIIVCGTSPLTLALCANLARRQLERTYYAARDTPPLPTLTIVAANAEEYRQDHEHHQQQLGFPPKAEWLDAVAKPPSLPVLTPLITATCEGEIPTAAAPDGGTPTAAAPDGGIPTAAPGGIPTAAVILVTSPGPGSSDATLGTRLAARFPTLPIFALDPKADEIQDLDVAPIVGQLRTFRLAMDVPAGLGHDAWERAAMLIHERFAAQARARGRDDEATKPWAQLNEFYRGSNRRTVRNALWMVEKIAGHTWDTFGGVPDAPMSADVANSDPLARLRAIGFDRDAAMAMAKAEHQDWCRYYRKAGWKYGPQRDNDRKLNPNLIGWHAVEDNPAALEASLSSLAATLYSLRELGYRSRPLWQRFRRVGCVTAQRRTEAWSWTSESGNTMRAGAGDWAVSDGDGRSWSVRDDVFHSSYQHIDGNRWCRCGFVRARPARGGERITTLEGPTLAGATDWVVKGAAGEEWVVPGDRFARQYEAVDSD